jgi:ornithine carbamoyltransferase
MKSDLREFKRLLEEIRWLDAQLWGKNILLTWQQSLKEVQQVLYTAEALKWLQDNNISAKSFESGLALFQDRDKTCFRQSPGNNRDPWPLWTTWNRFSFISAANLLGLTMIRMDEEVSEIQPADFSYLAGVEVIGFQDSSAEARVEQNDPGKPGDEEESSQSPLPGMISLQNHWDHPGRAMAAMLQLKHYFGSLERLAGKKITIVWSPAAGSGSSFTTINPLPATPPAVPQGLLALVTRFGMEVTLAYPEGYDFDPLVIAAARQHARDSDGTLTIQSAMEQALPGTEAVYPVNWSPGPGNGIRPAEADWTYGLEQKQLTRDGSALTLGYPKALEYQAYTVAALMVSNRFKEPARLLGHLRKQNAKRLIYPI